MLTDRKLIVLKSFFALILGALISIILMIYLIPEKKTSLGQFAGGADSKWVTSEIDGRKIHCSSSDFEVCLSEIKTNNLKTPVIHLYGASQLHTIRHYKLGQQPTPSYIKPTKNNFDLIALSEPNLNFQELFINYKTIPKNKLPNTIIIPIVIDDFKEDGLRKAVREKLFTTTNTQIKREGYAKHLMEKYGTNDYWTVTTMNQFEDKAKVFNGFRSSGSVQKYIENKIELYLDEIFSFKEVREQLSGVITIEFLRMTTNPKKYMQDIFSLDKKIDNHTGKIFLDYGSSWYVDFPEVVYNDNMTGLKELISDATAEGIKVILYYQPRPRSPRWPYSNNDLERIRNDIQKISKMYDVKIYDLENIVPDQYYGLDQVNGHLQYDLFHFDERGHQILGEALTKIIVKEL